ncbi:hypothetical protein CBR_g39370 [Chara braunii]|uniref:Reverse transcriptase domain-containing protein n=1 Tax=Chara braunii TaxID=69332 RepID=A0A388LRM8_CHABU|nr:hypothetical protein CBR_g39370 [Chara braunii]|eukprot:GBG84909.1 hypothetical protein CBR_g39370 [Chara braunii]
MINFCVIVYIDDILVYSETYHGHAQHIEWTLGALRDPGFKIALEKSEFFLSEILFLGYVVTRGGLRPDSKKVAAVKEASVPTSLTQVRAFLGLASYYRRFIKGFAAIARPLTNLLRKDQPLSWDAECQQAFATLKDALATAPILIRPDPSKQFILITDWQPEAISVILAQKGNDGREHVIEYASRTVSDERRNDSAPQGECYAVVWGIQHFHPYLYGQKFRLVTDHEPLLALKKLTNYTGMIGRWAVRLQEYDFDIVHRKTERHGNADGLTRLHRPAKWAALRAEEEVEEESEGELRREVGGAAARLVEDEEEEREAEEESAEAEEEEEDEAEEETSEEEEEAYSEYSEGEQSEAKQFVTKALEMGSVAMQRFDPVNQICKHICAFHFYSHDMTRQVEAHHYCSRLNEDFQQCAVYDREDKDARLIGIEYIVSEKVFLSLPEEEKKLWHSHEFEVRGGLATIPYVPEVMEHAELSPFAKTYGKVWHFWQIDRGDALPVGPPQLMMAFRNEGQMDEALLQGRDRRYGISTEELKRKRRDITGPDLGRHPSADWWEGTGRSYQVKLKEKDVDAAPGW